MSDPKAELAIKKLARLPANCVCPNCGTEKKFGFSTICMKYKTFVCNMCKQGHTAISHRCKSLTMSSWTVQEVESLTEAGGGGNNVARRTWLANAPPIGTGGRPREGEQDVNVFKRFVVQVYEERRYWADDAGAVAPPVATVPAHRPARTVAAAPVKRVPVPAPAPAAPAPDLLDFGAFESAPAAPAPAVAAPAPEPVVADFGAFESAPAPAAAAPVPAPAAATSASSFSPNFDAFGGSDPFAASTTPAASPPAAPTAAPQSGFGFIGNGPTSAPAPAPEQPKAKKPVMSMGGGGGNAAMISNMGGNAGVGAMNGGGMNMMMGRQVGYNNMAMNGGGMNKMAVNMNGGGMNNPMMTMNSGGMNNPMMNMNGGYNQTQQAQMMGSSQGMMMRQQMQQQQMMQQQMAFGAQGSMQQGSYGGNGAAQPSTSASVRDPFDSLFDAKK